MPREWCLGHLAVAKMAQAALSGSWLGGKSFCQPFVMPSSPDHVLERFTLVHNLHLCNLVFSNETVERPLLNLIKWYLKIEIQ